MKRESKTGGLTEILLKGSNLSTIDAAAKSDIYRALEEYKILCKCFDANFAPFPALNLIGIWGVFLETEHGVDRGQLLKIFTEETGLKL